MFALPCEFLARGRVLTTDSPAHSPVDGGPVPSRRQAARRRRNQRVCVLSARADPAGRSILGCHDGGRSAGRVSTCRVTEDLQRLSTALDGQVPAKRDGNLLIGTWNVRALSNLTPKW